jgi:hypothetical protein
MFFAHAEIELSRISATAISNVYPTSRNELMKLPSDGFTISRVIPTVPTANGEMNSRTPDYYIPFDDFFASRLKVFVVAQSVAWESQQMFDYGSVFWLQITRAKPLQNAMRRYQRLVLIVFKCSCNMF